jgi:hypothetical protein
MPQTLQINYSNLIFGMIALAGVVQFALCVNWSMNHYPGGYHWGDHFISDLGRTKTVFGQDNSLISGMFAQTTLILGLTLMPFMVALPGLFTYGKVPLRILGVLSSIGLIGIGQTPYDLNVDLHHVSLGLWVAPMAAMVILLPIFLKIDAAAPDSLIVLSLILLSATVLYGIAGFRTGYVVMQKVVVVLSIVWLMVVAISATIAAKHTPTNRQRLLADQAEWYSKRLTRRSRTKP